MRVIGLDYGSKTVGVALSDELMLTAQPLTTIHRDRPTKLRQTLAQIEQIIEQYDVDRIGRRSWTMKRASVARRQKNLAICLKIEPGLK